MRPEDMPIQQIVMTKADVTRAKRAVIVLNETLREAMRGKALPLELKQDMKALMELIRAVEKVAR